MAKLNPANLTPEAYPRFRGVLLTYENRTGIVVGKWPKKRGPTKDAKNIWNTKQFGLASRMAANAEPLSWETAEYLSRGTVWMPRDLLVMAAYGKLYEVTLEDGTVYRQADHSMPSQEVLYEWRTSAAAVLSGSNTAQASRTVRQRIANTVITNFDGLQSRVTFQASTSGLGARINAAYIGKAATSGDLYDFATTPFQLKFGGAAGTIWSPATSVVSDPVEWAPVAGDSVLITMAFGSPNNVARNTTLAGWQSWNKGGNDAATVNASGYTAGNPAFCISLLETLHAL